MSGSQQNFHGSVWLLICLALNAVALGLIKTLGATIPIGQLVFLRGLFGLILLVPWIWHARNSFLSITRWDMHILRVVLAGSGLLASFHAISELPLALFTAIDLSRALAVMVMAYVVLGEKVSVQRWIVGFIGLVGVMIATSPSNVPWSTGLLSAVVMVFCISGSIIVLRMMSETSPIVLITFFSAGVMVVSAPLALGDWVALSPTKLGVVCGVSLFSQLSQYCLVRAHWLAEASVLAPLGYVSLILAGIVGYIGFAEVPTLTTVFGSLLIVCATVTVAWIERSSANNCQP